MKNTNKRYIKIMFAAALAFSFAAEATDYTYNYTTAYVSTQDAKSFKQFEKELLGPYAKTNALTKSNLSHAYMTFMEKVRANHTAWGKQEWNHANTVMNKLDARNNAMDRVLNVSDKANIKVIQREYKSLESENNKKD